MSGPHNAPEYTYQMTPKELLRFENKVNKEGRQTEYVPTCCWEWLGGQSGGYGRIKVGGHAVYVHRLSKAHYDGISIPAGATVNHHCNNPSCVRPDHLYVGNQKMNAADRIVAGHHCGWSVSPMQGMKHAKAKLTDQKVRNIRKKYKAHEYTRPMLAKQYGVSRPTIDKIVDRKTWRHLL